MARGVRKARWRGNGVAIPRERLRGYNAPMRVLKLGTSNDFTTPIPEEARSYRVTQRFLAEATGLPVEVVPRVIWPDPGLPDLIEKWMAKYEPDLVLLIVNPYWMTFESVPLRLQRRFGRAGAVVGNAGTKAASFPRLAYNPVFRAGRRLALKTIGGDVSFEPREVVAVVEQSARRILRQEGVGLVIRGPKNALTHHNDRRGRARGEARRLETHFALQRLAEELHAGYVGSEVPIVEPDDAGGYRGDFVHLTEREHAERGRSEGEALLEVWREITAASPALTLAE